METFLNLNYNRLYLSGRSESLELKELHKPYFLASCDGKEGKEELEKKRRELIKKVEIASRNSFESPTLAKVTEIGEIEEYQSFVRFGEKRNVFRVYTDRPGDVPAVSNHLFFQEK